MERTLLPRRRRAAIFVIVSLFVALAPASAHAQAPGVAIEPKRLPMNDKQLVAKLEALREAGELMSIDQVKAALASPTPARVGLLEPNDEPLTTTELAARGREALLRVGWYYLCHRCNNWHVLRANGFALTADGVGVTCQHVLEQRETPMREGYLFAMNAAGEVFPVTAILAADEKLDTVIFRMDGSGFVPLPLNDQTAPGEEAYLFSDPKGVSGYFSAGHINRFYWDGNKRDGDPESLQDVRHLRIDLSTAWAPGSSGAAILDRRGNAVGHVTRISTERDRPAPDTTTARDDDAPTTNPSAARRSQPPRDAYILVLHEAIPARGVRLLVEAMNAATDEGVLEGR